MRAGETQGVWTDTVQTRLPEQSAAPWHPRRFDLLGEEFFEDGAGQMQHARRVGGRVQFQRACAFIVRIAQLAQELLVRELGVEKIVQVNVADEGADDLEDAVKIFGRRVLRLRVVDEVAARVVDAFDDFDGVVLIRESVVHLEGHVHAQAC